MIIWEQLFGVIGYSVILSILLAIWEIQIEGTKGWAEKLPCWKKTTGFIPEKIIGAPLTGYHLALVGFLFAMVHFPFVFVQWNIKTELQVLSVVLLILVIEDFLWFVLNPNFSFQRFRKKQIQWRVHWIGPLPTYYYIFSALAALFLYLSMI